MNTKTGAVHLFVVVAALGLGGCVAAAVVPVAQLAYGSVESSVKVMIDETTVTQEIRDAFASTRSIGLVAGDKASAKAADVLETQGGYLVTIDRAMAKNSDLTTSERRDALRKLCSNPSPPDMAMLARNTKKSDSNLAVQVLTYRTTSVFSWVIDLQVCRTNTQLSFTGNLEFDESVGSTDFDRSKMEDMAGAALGSKLIQVFGKASANASGATSPSSTAPSGQLNAAKSAGGSGLQTRPMTSVEVQQKLIELGYLSGKADGILGRQSTEALKSFQRDFKLPITGRPDEETMAKLANAKRKEK